MNENTEVVVKTKAADKQSPAVSVVIPLFVVKEYSGKCIESVIGQTMSDIEIICVDDGQDGDFKEVLGRYAEKDKRIRIAEGDSSFTSYGQMVNHGISYCKGEYVCIVKGEDLIDDGMLEKLYEASLEGEADVVCSSFCDYYENGRDLPSAVKNTEKDNFEASSEPFALKDEPGFLLGAAVAGAAIYKRSFLEENSVRFMEPEGQGCVDEPFFTEVLCRAEKIMWVNEGLYYRRALTSASALELKEDPGIMLDRLNDSFDIMEKAPFFDIRIKRYAYSRALACIKRLESEYDTDRKAGSYSNRLSVLMSRMDDSIVSGDLALGEQYEYYFHVSPLRGIRSRAPRLLIYNWLPFDNPWGWGGGVTVYCKNVISEIIKNNPEIEIYFLSSGFAYSATTTSTYYRRIDNIFGEKVKQYEIVNSPIPAEQRNLYVNPLVALENKTLKGVFAQFIKDYGPFEAIHFNNIEGLSLDVLDLKEDYPDTKFLFSIHNYVPLCVNGSYYMRHKHCNCTPDHTGLDCFRCTRMDIRSDLAETTYNRGLYGQEKTDCVSKDRWIKALDFARLDEDVSPDHILDFAKTATAKINKNCDTILAVSRRVYEIAAENGFDESKMKVQYIGTKVADRQIGHAASQAKDGLKIVFLGSDINFEEKGYAFLLDTLSRLSVKYSSRIDLFLTVKSPEHAEIYTMLRNFRSVKVQQGYTHDDLEWIFEDANLSIVPVLWEDNLPQIAIESTAYGVPVLSSSAGGAKELCDSELFRYECANSDDLNSKIMHFVDHPEDLQEYWKHHHGLVTMEQHWKELSECYGINNDEDLTYEVSAKDMKRILRENMFLRDNISLNEARFTPSAVAEELRKKLREANERNNKLEQEIKDMQRYNGKSIFISEYDPVQGNAGAALFRIRLDDFEYSDFYAEIKFVKLNNISFSSSDLLHISGTLLKDGDRNVLNMHQIEWDKEDSALSNYIYYYIRNNELYFFAKYTEKFSGFAWEIESLASRAAYDSARYEKIADTMITENSLLPADAFNSMGMLAEKLL